MRNTGINYVAEGFFRRKGVGGGEKRDEEERVGLLSRRRRYFCTRIARWLSLSLSRLGVNILNLFIKSACVIRARECAPLHPFVKRANSAGHGREVLIFDMLIRRN